MNAMTTKGFGRSGKVKRIPLKPRRNARPADDGNILAAGEGSSDQRIETMNMMTKIKVPHSDLGAGAEQWNSAITRWQEAKTPIEALEGALRTANAEFEKEEPSLDLIHWAEFGPVGNRLAFAMAADLEKIWLQFLHSEGKLWWARDAEAKKKKYRAAIDSVRAYRALRQECERKHNINELADELDRADDALCRAENELIALPAPHAEALAWKIEHIFGHDRCEDGYTPEWNREYIQPLFDDALRLAQR